MLYQLSFSPYCELIEVIGQGPPIAKFVAEYSLTWHLEISPKVSTVESMKRIGVVVAVIASLVLSSTPSSQAAGTRPKLEVNCGNLAL